MATSFCHQQLYLTWIRSIRSYDKFTAEGRTSTWTTFLRGVFVNVTLQAAVLLGRDYMENIRFTKYKLLKSVKQVFQVTEKLIEDQTEISGPRLISKNPRGDRRLYYVTKRLRLRLGTVCVIPQWPTSRNLENKIQWYLEIRYLKDLNQIDGKPMEFEWKIFPGFTTLGILEEIQKIMIDWQCEPEQFKGRIIFMSMHNDIAWWERGNTEKCMGPGSERKWYRTYSDKPDGDWDKTAENMMINFAESGHPVCRASSALERGELKSKGKSKKSIRCNGSDENIELLLLTVISANHLSIYGAVADLCKGLSKDSEVAGKPAANEDLDSMEILTELLTPTRSCRETCCKIMSINSNNCLKIRNCPNCAATPVYWLLKKKE